MLILLIFTGCNREAEADAAVTIQPEDFRLNYAFPLAGSFELASPGTCRAHLNLTADAVMTGLKRLPLHILIIHTESKDTAAYNISIPLIRNDKWLGEEGEFDMDRIFHPALFQDVAMDAGSYEVRFYGNDVLNKEIYGIREIGLNVYCDKQ